MMGAGANAYTNEDAILLLQEIIPKMASSHFRNFEKNISEKMVPEKNIWLITHHHFMFCLFYHTYALQNGKWNTNYNRPHSNQNDI